MKTNAYLQLAVTFESWASLARRVPWALALMCALVSGVPLTVSAQASRTVEFEINVAEAWRQDGGVWMRVVQRGVITNAAEVDYRTEPGTAQPGVDYVPVSGRLQFPPSAGDGYGLVLTVPILTNSPPGGDKDFRVMLAAPSAGFTLGIPNEVTVRILNDGIGFALEPRFGTNGVYELPEPAGDALVDVVILGDTATRPVSVGYRTEPVSATPGEDYTPVSGTLTFSAGETRKTIAIPIVNDSRYESAGNYLGGVESFRLRLENPVGGLPLSRPREVEIGIRDNDLGYVIAGLNNNYELLVEEKAGTVTVSVNRQGDFGIPSSVHYVVTTNSDSGGQGRAVAGVDFLPTEGTLTFGPSETNQTFTITLLDDNLIEGYKDFFIRLSEGTGGVLIATPEVRVFIRDSEQNLVRVDPDFSPDWPLDPLTTVVAPDGKIVLVTPTDRLTGEDGFLVVRLLPDGRVDPTWQAPTIKGFIDSLVVDTAGQVLFAAGADLAYYRNPPDGTELHPDFSVNGVARRHLARLHPDGSLDTGFSVQFPTGTRVGALARQSDGKILVALRSQQGDELFRLHSTGAVDTTFERFLEPEGIREIYPVPEGASFLAGYGDAIWRLNSDGRPDAGFQPPAGSYLRAMQPDGRLLVRVPINDVLYLARLTADGRLDSTFTPFADPGGSIALSTMDGKVWILQYGLFDYNYLELRRKNADGADDPAWPPASMRDPAYGCGPSYPELLASPDGNLLLTREGAQLVNGQHPHASLVRLLVNAPLPRFELDPASGMVPENGGKVPLKLVLCGFHAEPLTVTWHTEGGTARPGLDYIPAGGTLTFAVNESEAAFEIELIDNGIPDTDRTLRLRLQSPPPESRDYPLVELTIANDDLGFPPGGIQRFPNGRVLLRPTGYRTDTGFGGGASLEASDNLRAWSEPDLGGDWPGFNAGHSEVIDRTAPTNAARFYRLYRE